MLNVIHVLIQNNYFSQVTPATSLININLSMDGLPLHNSGPTQLWPILMTLPDFDPMPVLVVAIFCGASKPENAEGYLRQLVDELNHLSDQGTIINGKMIDIQLRAIIADTPARSFLKDIGVFRKLIQGFVTGALKPFPKWSPEQQSQVSALLLKIIFPSDINRKLRSLKYLPFWKASEFGSFLRHASIPILSRYISKQAFEHFKLFYVAVILLSSSKFEKHWLYAGILLEKFVAQFATIYHENHVTSNVHNLLHVVTDVKNHGPLPKISTYPFENKLFSMKNLVRSGPNPLAQVVNRVIELQEIEIATKRSEQTYPFTKITKQEIILHINKVFML
uniref:Uncharacterized protein n=1 Tax=Anopheles arabiensis TaxID=7173 RepID=A0A182HXD4_ANOAR